MYELLFPYILSRKMKTVKGFSDKPCFNLMLKGEWMV